MKGITRMRKRLIDDFIIPSLNSCKYGEKLCWVNKEKGIFRIYWSHKNAAKWQVEDTRVFQDWDRMKGHYEPANKNYFMSAKQRFRAALYKLSKYVTPLKSTEKTYRDYQLNLTFIDTRVHSENLSKSKTKGVKRVNQLAIPTPVICRNTSYVSKPVAVIQKDKPALPTVTGKLTAHQSIYVNKINKKRRDHPEKSQQQNLHARNNKVGESSVLRENSSTFKTSHIAPQQVPVFSSYSFHPPYPIHNGPSVFVSQIYNEYENVPQRIAFPMMTTHRTPEERDAVNGILNLSLKSPCNSPPSR